MTPLRRAAPPRERDQTAGQRHQSEGTGLGDGRDIVQVPERRIVLERETQIGPTPAVELTTNE